MEHNTEKNIRQKLQQAEQYPVRWRRDELWARMEIHRNKRSKRPVYFSMAASLTIAVLAGVYSYQHLTDIPDKIKANVKTESTFPGVANPLSHKSKDTLVNIEGAGHRNSITQNSARIRIEEDPYISTSAMPAASRDTATLYDTSEEVITPAAVPENTNIEVATENAAKHVKVIVGIIPPREQPLVTQHEKKKKFRFLKGKSQDEGSEGNQLIIARIN